MAIRKRGRGRWQVRVRPFPEMTVPTRAAAETIELDLKLRVKLGHLYREKPVSLGQELDGYLARKVAMGGRRGQLRPKSIAFLHQSAKPWEPLRKVLIPNLRRAIVEDCVAARAAVAPVAAANELELLKACLRAAASRGQAVDPGIFEIAPVRHEPAEGVALELAQVHAIGSTMPERIKRLVPFCGTVGLRFSEAVTLTDDRVDLEAGEIFIPHDLNKGRRAKGVPLARFEVQLLREQLLARPCGTLLVFPNEKGGVYSKSGFRAIWLPALFAAGLAHKETNANGRSSIVADFRFHWLRHTAISLMARAGMKPELIAERVGHRDGGGLIYRRYRHLFPSEVRAAVGLLDALVSEANVRGAAEGSGQ
ncbi:MAG: tyrosine-type recombinase/integrase [Actinobacteria bacterium]|nr:tyrosine-type recombinase/integrase [Actinomycetota bacterium]